MSTSAKAGIGSKLYISSGAGSPVTITGIAKTFPAIVTATAHGLANGTVVTIAGVAGMTEINSTTAVVVYKTANSFALAGVDATGYTAYTSGGTATPQTYQAIGGVKEFDLPTAKVNTLDVTDLDSVAKEFIGGLVDNGDAKGTLQWLPSDTGQVALKAAFDGYLSKTFKLTSASSTFTFSALVADFGLPKIAPEQVMESSFTLKVSGAVTIS